MAFLHRTWFFDPVAAHERIAARVVKGGASTAVVLST